MRGTDKKVSFAHVADVAYHGAALPADGPLDPGLEVTEFYDPPDTNDPQAMHLAVVIVDPTASGAASTYTFSVREVLAIAEV